jgi:hypothetical protein
MLGYLVLSVNSFVKNYSTSLGIISPQSIASIEY